jgi:single-strand DNA-binding protein
MTGVNKAILIGNLGRDPELRRTANGSSVVSFPLATTERWTDKNGEKKDRTEWHNIVAWGKLADLANQYLSKGRSTYIEGRITTNSWDDKDGNKRYRTEIVATQIQFLGGSNPNTTDDAASAVSTDKDVESDDTIPEPEPAVEDDLPF